MKGFVNTLMGKTTRQAAISDSPSTLPGSALKRTRQLLATTAVSLLLASGLAVGPVAAQTPPTLTFGGSLSLSGDNGSSTAVAMNASNQMIEVHQAERGNETSQSFGLYYHVGWIDSSGGYHWNPSYLYDTGYSPHIALNNSNYAVEVHASSGELPSTLWYHVANIQSNESLNVTKNSIWYASNAMEPTVAVNDNNIVVEEDASTDGSYNFTSRVGLLLPYNQTIQWYGSQQYDNGRNPQIAINNNNQVVEVHNEGGGGNLLYYRTGCVINNTLYWGPSICYDNGYNPSVGITSDGLVVETHSAGNLHGWGVNVVGLYKRTGAIFGNDILWSNPVQFDSGAFTSIACNDYTAVETTTSCVGSPTLWYHIGWITR